MKLFLTSFFKALWERAPMLGFIMIACWIKGYNYSYFNESLDKYFNIAFFSILLSSVVGAFLVGKVKFISSNIDKKNSLVDNNKNSENEFSFKRKIDIFTLTLIVLVPLFSFNVIDIYWISDILIIVEIISLMLISVTFFSVMSQYNKFKSNV